MLTLQDKNYINDRIELHINVLETQINKKFGRLEVLFDEKLTEKLKSYVDKDLFLTYMDKILGRLVSIEQEMLFTNNRIEDHEERIVSVEESLKLS